MTTTAPTPTPTMATPQFSDDAEERAAQVAALVAERKARLAREKKNNEEKAMKSKLFAMMFDENAGHDEINSACNDNKKKEFKQFRVGGAKGKEGRADHTRGKSAFKRPCTVGWKSQNQPLMKGGGNRTPL